MHALVKPLVLASSLLFAGTASCVGEGEMAPDFVLPVLGAETTKSLSASHGKVRYVDFWASWCPPCRVSVPEIVALQTELGVTTSRSSQSMSTNGWKMSCGSWNAIR